MLLKKMLAVLAMLATATAFAAVEANKASPADLDGIKGVGPSMSQKIVDARKQGEFKNWDDFVARVKGVKAKKAEKLSAEGLTVNGQPYKAAAAAAPAASSSPATTSAKK